MSACRARCQVEILAAFGLLTTLACIILAFVGLVQAALAFALPVVRRIRQTMAQVPRTLGLVVAGIGGILAIFGVITLVLGTFLVVVLAAVGGSALAIAGLAPAAALQVQSYCSENVWARAPVAFAISMFAVLLYWVRTNYRFAYALLEMALGVLVVWGALSHADDEPIRALATLAGGVYFLVRGVDNASIGWDELKSDQDAVDRMLEEQIRDHGFPRQDGTAFFDPASDPDALIALLAERREEAARRNRSPGDVDV
jgi:hypothetical protein